MEILRAVVRPFLALSSWCATIAFLVLGTHIPDAWWAVVSAITTFYFVQRREEKREKG